MTRETLMIDGKPYVVLSPADRQAVEQAMQQRRPAEAAKPPAPAAPPATRSPVDAFDDVCRRIEALTIPAAAAGPLPSVMAMLDG
jgi:hypothetical protein